MSDKYKLNGEEVNKIILHSPYALGDAPYKRGLGATQIKKYFFDYIAYLARMLNIHLGDMGDDVESLNKAILEINRRLGELHETDQIINQSLGNKITQHLNDALAHSDMREEISLAMSKARDAYSLASGKTRVHVEISVEMMFMSLYHMDTTSVGDYIVITARNVPDFIVLSKSGIFTNATEISITDIENGVELEWKSGEMYTLKEKEITVIAVESGIDVSQLTTKEEYNFLLERLSELEMEKPKKFELLGTVTVTPDTDGALPSVVTISGIDDNGEAIEFTDFYVNCLIGISDTSKKIALFVNSKHNIMGNYALPGVKSDVVRRWAFRYDSYGENNGGIFTAPATSLAATSSYPNNNVSNSIMVVLPPKIKEAAYQYNSFTNVTIQVGSLTGEVPDATFIDGTTFELWGVRK